MSRHSTEVKIAWLREWLLQPENRLKTFAQTRDAVRANFGETLGTGHLNRTISEVRRPAATPAKPQPNGKGEAPGQALLRQFAVAAQVSGGAGLQMRDVVAACKMAMEAVGIESIRLRPDGNVEIVTKV